VSRVPIIRIEAVVVDEEHEAINNASLGSPATTDLA